MASETRVSQRRIIRGDWWLLSALTWIPPLLALMIWWIFSQGIVQDLPIGVVDLEHSSLSRTFTRELDATASLAITNGYSDIYSAKEALVSKAIYAYVVIPKGFERDIYLGSFPQISVFYNSQFILVGKLINSAVLRAHGTFNAQVGALKQLKKGNNTTASAVGQAVAIQTQIAPLFNQNSNYAQFLVSAIVPAIWPIVMTIATILFLAANLRCYGLRAMMGTHPIRSLLLMWRFYAPIFLLQGVAFLLWFYHGLKWPMQGSLLPIIFAQLLTVIACLIMGSLFFFIALHPARAMSFAAAFTAPSFAFMGVTFPVTDMNGLAQFWRSLLPASHYIEAQISQVSYGVSSWETISGLYPMFGYLLPLALTLLLIKKHLAKLETSHDSH